MNFIQSGDIEKTKFVIVSWYKTCKPLFEGGLSIRSLSSLNEASKIKDFRNSTQVGDLLLQIRVLIKQKEKKIVPKKNKNISPYSLINMEQYRAGHRPVIGAKIENRHNRRLDYLNPFPPIFVVQFRRFRFNGYHEQTVRHYRFGMK